MAIRKTFWHMHGSTLFVAGQAIVSTVLITLSIALHGNEPTAGILSHLAAMFLAAFVATVFFSFRDVRETLAGSIGTLMLDGQIVGHLSSHARDTLARHIILANVGNAKRIPDTLYRHISAAQSHVFAIPHLHNYAPTIVLSDELGRPDLIRRDYRCTYLISTAHLAGERHPFTFRFRHEVFDPTGLLSKENILTTFEAHVGPHVFTLDDINKVTEHHPGGLNTTVLSMQRELEVTDDTPVSVAYDGIASRLDPMEILYARYPTRGYRVTLWHSEGITYDVAWFRLWTTSVVDFRGEHQVVRMRNGITAHTDEWLMPGNGVVLSWFSLPADPKSSEGSSSLI